MEQITGIDWALVKLQYEMMDESIENLAAENGTTTQIIEYAIRTEGWKRIPLAQATKDWSDIKSLDQLTDTVVDQIKTRMTALALIKQNAMTPRYIALETALIGKAMEILKNLDLTVASSSAQLKNVAEVFDKLKTAGGMFTQVAEDNNGDTGKTIIAIKNEFYSDGPKQIEPQLQPQITTVSVSAGAGEGDK